ncbi:S-adenosyl-L-methionine-dependent methyltransferase [Trichophyton interdigitale]|uniref:tRNA (guanine(26)-N(2))-dimethyltransferase n=1 Tax=Trichophyton interdigitale TaxID=101480 RepID=A0A9P5CXX8_9EURO|nr:S-adenosyl-L-methionine-dependent methyltransferase [Trichophyton interdigitale]KAF3897227.1 S-adenosyl-L-methionine-dependent methyltransferase [Trichophyton interdigitale]KAG8209799.1 S-adenosyl-L-methionine-dependent methyltransferase [Trichophyton interdigitale]
MLLGRLGIGPGLGLRCVVTKPLLLLSTTNAKAPSQLARRMASTEETPKLGTISSLPKQGQLIKHGSTVYKTIQEGLAYILVDQKDAEPAKPPPLTQNQKTTEGDRPSVFYNPIQQFNRDLSVLAIRAYGEHATAIKQKKRKLKLKGRKTPTKKAKADEGNERETKPTETDAPSAGDQVKAERAVAGVNKRRWEDEETPVEDTPLKKLCTETRTNGDEITGSTGEEVAMQATDGTVTENTGKIAGNASPKPWTPSFTILDALSASGLRALRYAKEIPFATRVVGNDLSAAAIESMKLNVQHNGLEDRVHPNKGDACAYMYTVGRAQGSPNEPGGIPKFDVVDLDPYGTAAPFLDAAVQSVADGGLLCVTCTDAGVFAGAGYPEKTFALYGGIPIRGSHSHEGGLRLILHAIGTAAGKYGLAIEPMLSLSIDFYARVFVRIHKAPIEVKFAASKTMVSFNCDHGCGSWKTQRLAERKPQTGKDGKTFYSYGLAQGPTAAPNCEHCGFKTHIAGPMWAGPLHNLVFIQRILDLTAGADRDTYQTCPRIEGMLTTALEEDLDLGGSAKEPTPEAEPVQPDTKSQETSLLIPRVDPALIEPYPFFFIVSNLARVLRTSTMPEIQFHGALRSLGYKSTRSHAKPNSIRTNAPWEVVWEIMREWVRLKSPIKPGALTDSTAGAGILRRNRHTLNPVPGEAPGLKALKRDLLTAVDSSRSIADITMMVQAALYRSGVHQSIETVDRHSLEEMEKNESNDEVESNGSSTRPSSPSTLQDPSTLNVVFDGELGKKALNSHRRKRLKRYQANPRPNWGPIARAHVTNTTKDTT